MTKIRDYLLSKVPALYKMLWGVVLVTLSSIATIFFYGWNAKEKSDRYIINIAEAVYDRKSAPRIIFRDAQYGYIRDELNILRTATNSTWAAVNKVDGKLDAMMYKLDHYNKSHK